MGYTDSLLAEGEVIALRGKQHWLALILDSRAAIGVWILAAVLFAASIIFRFTGDVANLIGIIVLVLVVIGLVIFAYRWLRWVNEDYVVTNRRMLKVQGILNKRSMDSSLEKINDLVLEENLLGRLMDYGDLDIVTASDVAIDRFRMLNHAKTFKKEMLEQKHELEQGDFYKPSPPIMAGTSPVAAEYAPPPQPRPTPPASPPQAAPVTAAEPAGAPDTAPAPDAASVTAASAEAPVGTAPPSDLGAGETVAGTATASDIDETRDVTRTLARLADLRDRGAITAEDYEAKKTELLGRL